MITTLRVRNFKALRDIEIELTPIHVLIGPNDTGKTSILDAFAALCRSVDHILVQAFLGSWKGAELVWGGDPNSRVSIDVDFDHGGVTGYSISVLFGVHGRQALLKTETIKREHNRLGLDHPEDGTSVKRQLENPSWSVPHSDELKVVQELLSGVQYYRWDPRFLALRVAPDAK